MHKLNLSVRKTFAYVGEWQHLDKWQHLDGAARLTHMKEVDPGDGSPEDGGTYLRWATLPRGVDRDLACKALVSVLTKAGCSHEHDCCGCMSMYTSVHHRQGRRVVLKTTVSYNY